MTHVQLATDDEAVPQPATGVPEVVVLGASNVTRNLNVLIASLQATFSDGVRLFVAHGHGRSYGVKSRVLLRQLEGHVDSALWPAVAQFGDRRASRYALITDVGNDLLYGIRVDDILGWVGQCASRLKADGYELAISGLPMESLLGLSNWRYTMTSRFFFPTTRVPWSEMQEKIHSLNDGLRVIARGAKAGFVEPDSRWYGFDPIHFRRRYRFDAMRSLLGGWSTAPDVIPASSPLSDTLRLWTSRPARKWIGGRLIETPQPTWSTCRQELWLF